MSTANQGIFRADHVGSLLRTEALKRAREAFESGRLDRQSLRQVEDDAIRDAVRLQRDVGLGIVTDGEFRRRWWHLDFLTAFASVERYAPKVKARFKSDRGDLELDAPGLRITGKISRTKPIFLEHFAFLKGNTAATPKISLPSPTILHFRGGRDAIDKVAYPDIEEFFHDVAQCYAEEIRDLAAAGCKYLQIDETNLAYLCDPAIRGQVRDRLGIEPDALLHRYVRLINDCVAARPRDMKVMMHICRGNYCSGWAASGGYEPVADVAFNSLDVDGFLLEFDDERSGGFSVLRHMGRDKVAVLGLVTTKRPQIEAEQGLLERIDQASRFLPLEQLALSPQCGFASTCEGNLLDEEDQRRKLELVVRVADKVWN
ncbi:MAG: hypothetical protein RLZZ200_2555 [Pseudomonadota bacterium]